MSADSAHQRQRRPPPRAATPPRRTSRDAAAPRGQADPFARPQRNRRAQRFRQRRRDLLTDIAIAFVIAITALVLTPGLGVIAVAAIPVSLALVGTVLAQRRARKRG